MTATNHAITGALIGLIVGQPALALPTAFLSHFVCDAIPHYGNDKLSLRSKNFKRLLVTDAGLCILLVALLALRHPAHWLLAAICAFVATSPDLLWFPRFVAAQRPHQKRAPESKLSRLLGSNGIQWFQRPIGAAVEAFWLLAGLSLLVAFVK